jgi:hypothetical protein
MQTPTTPGLLAAWELGRAEPHPAQRAVALLGALYPDTPRAQLAQLSIGKRDAALLALRRRAFGAPMSGLAACPECGERLELQFKADDLQGLPAEGLSGWQSVSVEGYEVDFRLPNSADVAAVCVSDGTLSGEQQLLERIVSRAEHAGAAIRPADLPEAVLGALEEKMTQADPPADLQLDLTCENCGARWQSPFDIASFLWSEVDAWAIRLLREVHCLARAYAWREVDILAMSPWRRQVYLELLSA